MQHSRQEVADMLRKAGFTEAADRAATELPDPVDVQQAVEWAGQYGITTDMLISAMGGSP